jgi:hypothetical protein
VHFYDPREWRPLTEAALLLGNRGRGRLPLFYDEGRDELDRGVAGIDAKMNFAGFNIECLACPVSGCGAPFVFKHQPSFQNISDRPGWVCLSSRAPGANSNVFTMVWKPGGPSSVSKDLRWIPGCCAYAPTSAKSRIVPIANVRITAASLAELKVAPGRLATTAEDHTASVMV